MKLSGCTAVPVRCRLLTAATLVVAVALGTSPALAQALVGTIAGAVTDSSGAVRPSTPTGTGLPRAAQFGLRVMF
jgi:hypothetical protein